MPTADRNTALTSSFPGHDAKGPGPERSGGTLLNGPGIPPIVAIGGELEDIFQTFSVASTITSGPLPTPLPPNHVPCCPMCCE